MSIIDFKAARCLDCYKCVRHCEVKAIRIKDMHAEIIENECILCGTCMNVCLQKAKTLHSELDKVRGWIKSGKKVVASIAPSYYGVLKYKTIGQVHTALLRLGFADVRETSEGAAVVTSEYRHLLHEGKMENIITTCCPGVNDLIEIHYPELCKYLAPYVSPMIAHGRILKKEYGGDALVVFIGPCIAKMKEMKDSRHDDAVDAVLSFSDISRWLGAESIDIETCEDTPFDRFDPRVNRLYPVSSGVISSVVSQAQAEADGYHKFYVHGTRNCMDLCDSIAKGDMTRCFIEMNLCYGGCIKGPTVDKSLSRFKVKVEMEENIPKEPVPEEILEKLTESLDFSKEFYSHAPTDPMPTEEEIWKILNETGKYRVEDMQNCGACGYDTCWEKAIAVFQGKAELDMCIPYMKSRAETLSNVVMEQTPNMVIIVDKDMKIKEYSAVGERFFGVTRGQAKDKLYLYELIDPSDFEYVLQTHRSIHGKKVHYGSYGLYTLQNIVYIQDNDSVLATIIDITAEEEKAAKDYDAKLETIDLAQKVIHKQMMVAQEIAGLLGETTADTKTTLTKLCRSLLDGDGTPQDDKYANAHDFGHDRGDADYHTGANGIGT